MGHATTDMTCPKCHAPMRTYERSGIHIDQCTECRGVFLDRGELERLIDAEATAYDTTPVTAPSGYPGRPADRGDDRDRGREYGGYGGHPGKRRRGFLSDLFD